MKGIVLFLRGDNSNIEKIYWQVFENRIPQNQIANFNLAQSILGEREFNLFKESKSINCLFLKMYNHVVQRTNLTENKKCRFSILIWPLGIKWKFRNLIAHLQDMPNHILEYHLSTLWNLLALNWPLGQKWRFQNLIARYSQSDP